MGVGGGRVIQTCLLLLKTTEFIMKKLIIYFSHILFM